MDFDGLDDILQDNSYVPSFAPKEMKRNSSVRDKMNVNKIEKSIQNQSVPLSSNNNKTGGLFGLHKESAKKEPTTFEEFFSREKEVEKKNVGSLEKNKSVSNFNNINSSQRQDDADTIFSAQRTATRRPISKQRQSEKQLQVEPAAPRRGMMPPLSKKNQVGKKQFVDKMDTNNSMDLNDNLNVTKPVMPKFKDNDLDPLEALNKEQGQKMKKFLQDQIQFQKKTLQSMIQQQRTSKKKQIQALKKLHEQQLKKKLELKDYELSKLKQFYEMQLNLKTSLNTQKKQLSVTSSKMDQNLIQLKKIQARINQQYTLFRDKQVSQGNLELGKREAGLDRREKELGELEKRLQDLEKDLKTQKLRIYQEQERERNRLSQMTIKLNQRQSEFQTKYKRKQKDLSQEYEKKKIQLDHQKQKMRYETIELQQKKMQVEEQQRELKKRVKGFEDRQKQILEELHIQRTKQMEKQIEISGRESQLSMKQSQVQMERQDLINKMKILELQRKKLQLQAKGSLKSVFPNSQNSMEKGYTFNRNKISGSKTSQNFDSYHKSITQMRDQLMKSMPKF